MRTTSRIAVSSLVLGGALALAPAASAQQACTYPFDCPDVDASVVERSPAQPQQQAVVDSTANEAATLPFTGGELTMLSLVGAGALAGGVALVAAGRKRKTA